MEIKKFEVEFLPGTSEQKARETMVFLVRAGEKKLDVESIVFSIKSYVYNAKAAAEAALRGDKLGVQDKWFV